MPGNEASEMQMKSYKTYFCLGKLNTFLTKGVIIAPVESNNIINDVGSNSA